MVLCVNLREFVKLTPSWPPARVEGGSEQHFMTPLPWDNRDNRDNRANTQKLFFEYSFVNLTHFSVKDVHFSTKSRKIDKIHKIHAPKNPGACFFWGRRSAAGSHHQSHSSGGTKKTVKIAIIRHFFFRKCWFFKIWKLKCYNMSGNSFRISKNPDTGKSRKSENRRFSYKLPINRAVACIT